MTQNIVKFRKSLYAYLGIIALVLPALAVAGPHTPETISGATPVTVERAKSLMDRGVLMVDARVANEYVEQHIKGAINIPYKEKSDKSVKFNASKDRFDLSKLPADKNTEIIFYCNGSECWKSFKATTVAVKAGYKKLYWMRDGIPGWKAKGFPVE
jgi:rhodanese-related sulfurtransferase